MHTSFMQRTMNMRNTILSAVLALALVACGGDKAFVPPPDAGGGGAPPPAAAAALIITSNTPSIPVDGSSAAEISALVVDGNNVVIPGAVVAFSTSSGALSAGSAVTAGNGIALVTLTTGGNPAPRNITVTATSGPFSQSVSVSVGATSSGATPANLALSATIASIPADGSATTSIRALVRDASNVAVPGIPVTLSASSGALSGGSVVTGSDGIASATLSTGGDSSPRNITVTARSAEFTATVTVAVGTAASSVTVSALSMIASSTSIPSDGSSEATVVAIARDADNRVLPGVPVSFSATSGGLEVTRGVTDNSGQAVALLTTAGDSSTRTITVTATTADRVANVSINVAPATSENTIQIGNGSGLSFVPNVIGIAPAGISAGGSTSLNVTFVRQDNSLHTLPVTVTFNSPCLASGTAEFRVGGEVRASLSTTTGQANITYVDKGCAGIGASRSDLITATANVGGQSLAAAGTVVVSGAAQGAIAFVSAAPAHIALRGTGEASRPETSALVFRVTNSVGGPVPNQQVNFALSTTVGGITLSAPDAVTDAQGNVQVVVIAGTVATPVRVSAVVDGSSPAIATVSSALNISTGIPTDSSFSISANRHNIDGWLTDGRYSEITVRLADRFGNPVPDGTPVSFWTEGGSVQAQCQTETRAEEGGLCSVQLRSSNPRPIDGRVTVLATAIGEESFVDANGNGMYDAGESFVGVAEPWLDANENGAYDLGEMFYDFFPGDGYTPADALFNGVLCNADCADSRTIGLGQQIVIVFSDGGNPRIDLVGGPISLAVNTTTQVSFHVRDSLGNPLPAGTNVVATVSPITTGLELAVLGASAQVVPSTAVPLGVQSLGETLFNFTLEGKIVSGTGTFILTLEVEGRSPVSATFPITVTP